MNSNDRLNISLKKGTQRYRWVLASALIGFGVLALYQGLGSTHSS